MKEERKREREIITRISRRCDLYIIDLSIAFSAHKVCLRVCECAFHCENETRRYRKVCRIEHSLAGQEIIYFNHCQFVQFLIYLFYLHMDIAYPIIDTN